MLYRIGLPSNTATALALFAVFMPPTSKKLRGHTGLILSVCPLRFLADTIS